MSGEKHVTTAEELLRMPDDGYRYELLRGELRRMTPPGYEHGEVAMNLALALGQHVKANDLGAVCAAETGFLLASDPDLVRAPDVAFVRRDRRAAIGRPVGYWPGPPDLAAEVLSPSDTYTDVQAKVFDWLDAGTRMVVLIDPRKRAATVYRSRADVTILSERGELDGGEVVPGWSMPVAELFAD